MDTRKIADILRGTIDPNLRQDAEAQLNQLHKIIGFAPSLLKVIMQNDIDMPVRQAGAIYLKNLITTNWQESETEPGQPVPFSIHEQDRAMIRDNIVEAIVHAPDIIRVQLCVCLNIIIKNDFPGRWTQVVDKISIYLQNPDLSGWTGALFCLYQLVKNYEYKKAQERAPLLEAMNLLLPLTYNLMVRLMNDQSEQSVLLQKLVLKIYYALTQYTLSLELITNEVFAQWMEICHQIIARPAPDSSSIDEDERPELPWWKVKKWATHIVLRLFERYGSPGNTVSKEYEKLAEWYLPTFSAGLLEALLKVLDQYRNKVYVSPRVMCDILTYLKHAISHSYTWKLMKPHIVAIIQDVIFPLLCYSEADDELWESDPVEYIRLKFDVFDDYTSPVPAAENVLHSICKTRKGVLPQVMQVLLQIINTPTIDAKQKDGALHMVGALADVLLKKKVFKDQVESLLSTYVFPEFQSPHGHLRARACWVLHSFSDIKVKNPQFLTEILRLTTNALLTDKELPVKVEAAVALRMYLVSQDNANAYIEPKIKEITLELLTIIRETENEDLTNVLQKIVGTFSEQLLPIAVEICQHLATTFSAVLESEDSSDDKAITAMGLLNTMETLLSVMEEHPEIMANLHPIVLQVVGHIFQQSVSEFYEEAFSLVYDLTSKSISPDMWKLLELIYQLFQKDGIDYFVDMMPALHNYITVDTPAFVSNQNHVLAMFNMCKTILTGTNLTPEESECNAAKLLEVIILQCKGQIDECIPSFVELALARLTREVKTSELRTMCLQVVISALYYNPQLLIQVLDKLPLPVSNESISAHFIKQWIHDTDCFLGIHDRKLCVLGICTLISLGDGKPPVLSEVSDKIIPALILIFEGLNRAYAARAAEDEEEESEDDDDDCEEGISSDEDEIDELGPSYYERVAALASKKGGEEGLEITASVQDGEDDSDDDDDDDSADDLDETALEGFTTPIDDEDNPDTVDEYIAFQEVMNNLSTQDPQWYAMLLRGLTAEQQKSLQEVFVLAEQKKVHKRSKEIEKSGGFRFTQQTVPQSFNFTTP